ncbi:carboxylic acid transporter [Moniliophthora roreri]|nr:carboxylic acid transporter [Moniliophthora roreri]
MPLPHRQWSITVHHFKRWKKPVFSLYRLCPRNRVPVLCLPALVGGGYFRTMNVNGDAIPKYAAVQDILVGAAALCSLIFAPFGPENHGLHFERYKTAFDRQD